MRKWIWSIVVVVIVAAAAITYAVVHKPAKTTTSSTTSTSTSQPAATQTSKDIIQTKTSGSIGQYLADSSGMALYTYGADKTGVSNCTGSCLYSWPIYDASNAPATLPANVTVITRSDGGKQYAYKGMPLYTFTSDSSGQVTGNNVSDFHVAKP